MSGTSTRDAAGFGDTLLATFFREYRELESQRVLSRNDVSAEVRATWCHDMGRSYVDLIVIREDARGNLRQPRAGASATRAPSAFAILIDGVSREPSGVAHRKMRW